MNPLVLSEDPLGRLVLEAADGRPAQPVTPVRAFPLTAPDEGIALIAADGHEVAWIDKLADLPADTRQRLVAALAEREFTPTIRTLKAVSSYMTPSHWTVDTDRGETTFVLRSEDDLRYLPDGGLLITDLQGISYRIASVKALDAKSRRMLDRFS